MPRTLAHSPVIVRSRAALDGRLVAGVLALATTVAAALRLPFLGTQSIWFDETYTIHVVRAGSLAGMWHRVGASESTPPLFYAATWIWTHALGSWSAAGVRTVSALAIVAAVPVAYVALRRLAGVPAALATAALLAVSPLLTWYALDARAYGLLVLTGLLSVWAFAAVLCDGATRRRFALWALAATAAIWTHWFAGFLVLGEVVVLLWLRPRAWRATVAASAAVLLALAPLIGLLREQTGDARAAFIADSRLTDRVEQFARQFAAGQNVPRTWLEGATLALALAALAVGVLLTARRALAAPGDRSPRPGLSRADAARALLGLTGVSLLVPLLLGATELYDRFDVRNVLFAWPLVAALAAPALLRLRAVPLGALLALGLATSLWGNLAWPYENTDWRGAIARVEARAPAQPVIAVGRLGIPVAALYLHRAPATEPLAARRAWLVVEPARSPGHRELGPLDPPLVAQLLARFPQHAEQRVHGFRVIKLSAAAPVALDPSALPDAALFAGGGARRPRG
ncbi:MAG TPA: glycosyltransferase family 39 protein [Conexibacter sp.]|nr:glycosyltransferase family 39 protein [Conexibacter sp.]